MSEKKAQKPAEDAVQQQKKRVRKPLTKAQRLRKNKLARERRKSSVAAAGTKNAGCCGKCGKASEADMERAILEEMGRLLVSIVREEIRDCVSEVAGSGSLVAVRLPVRGKLLGIGFPVCRDTPMVSGMRRDIGRIVHDSQVR